MLTKQPKGITGARPRASAGVPKYGRDDAVPQLCCQERLLVALGKGWMPAIPLDRGVHELELQLRAPSPAVPADGVADTECETSQSDASSSFYSDQEFDLSDCCVDDMQSGVFQGP